MRGKLIRELSSAAENCPVHESAPIALDWINGRRTPDANQNLKAAIINLSLGTKAPHIFRALVEAICFGAKKIVDRFEMEGVKINTVVGIGGLAKKSPFVIQTLSNELDMPIKVARSEQAPALGSAMYAAVAAGLYNDVQAAKKAIGSGFEAEYYPQEAMVPVYYNLYLKYEKLGAFVESMTEAERNKIHQS